MGIVQRVQKGSAMFYARGKRAGFTMVELAITLLVLAILTAMAAPSFADFIDRYRLRGAIDDVLSVIAHARTASVKSSRDVSIAFAGTIDDWCVGASAAGDPGPGEPIPAAAACDCVNAAACQVDGQRLAVDVGQHRGVRIDAIPDVFVFNSRLGTAIGAGGVATPDAMTFSSPSGKYDMRVDVSALGQARACIPVGKPAIAGVPSC
jgi:type IV fimbrial biogenesis protein FimT